MSVECKHYQRKQLKLPIGWFCRECIKGIAEEAEQEVLNEKQQQENDYNSFINQRKSCCG